MKVFSMLKMFAVVIALTAILSLPNSAQAGYSLVTSRSALAGDDYLDWGTLGVSTNTQLSNPFSITSANGVTATVSSDFLYFFNNATSGVNNYPPYWQGDFTPNAPLVQGFNSLTISLPSPVYGGGAQIEPNLNPSSSNFTAEITALDASNHVLASFTESGVNDAPANIGDNSAIFIGIAESGNTANISKIQFQITEGVSNFAINQFDFRTTPEVSAVSEPASLTLLGVGSLCLLGYRWRRRRASASV